MTRVRELPLGINLGCALLGPVSPGCFPVTALSLGSRVVALVGNARSGQDAATSCGWN